nr:YchJ family metal-binding protein [uncultured Flavobacterium sp.]
MSVLCPCGSQLEKDKCCLPYINGTSFPQTPEALMRSRYTAYTLHNADYIYLTTTPNKRKYHSKTDILAWAKSCHWVKLEVLSAKADVVTFKAYYLDEKLRPQVHYERSVFEKINDVWYYKDGTFA